MAGKSPSGSAPERVNSSVWHTPVALISTSTSPARGPSRSTSSTTSDLPASNATAARVFMVATLVHRRVRLPLLEHLLRVALRLRVRIVLAADAHDRARRFGDTGRHRPARRHLRVAPEVQPAR